MKYKSRRFKTAFAVWRKRVLTSKNFFMLGIMMVLFVIVGPLVVAVIVQSSYTSRIAETVEAVKPSKTGIVFGDSLSGNGVSDGVEERLQAAAELYKESKIQHLLISGDSTVDNQAQPQRMQERAVQLGIAQKDITVDQFSLRTYDSCHRAKNKYQITDAVLISQSLHLARALYICNSLGLRATGYASHSQNLEYGEDRLRETLAFVKAMLEVNIAPPNAVN